MLLIGSHCHDSGGIHMALRRAARGGMPTLQIFTAIPRFYNEKVGVKPERLARWKETLEETGIDASKVLAHAAYVLNVAGPDQTKWEKAARGLAREYERASTLGLGGVCFHPGAATDGDRDSAIERVAEAMRSAFEAVPEGRTRLLIENTAGGGTTIGRNTKEVAAILGALSPAERRRAGYGLDTCHMFASGFPIAASREIQAGLIDAFEVATGEAPAFFHLNDSEGALGSNKDRHRCIGQGEIGGEAFGWLLADPRAQDIPLILETPHARQDVAEDDDSPDPQDLESIALLRELAESARL